MAGISKLVEPFELQQCSKSSYFDLKKFGGKQPEFCQIMSKLTAYLSDLETNAGLNADDALVRNAARNLRCSLALSTSLTLILMIACIY